MLTVDTVCTVVEVRGEIAIARNYFVGYCYSELSVQLFGILRLADGHVGTTLHESLNSSIQ